MEDDSLMRRPPTQVAAGEGNVDAGAADVDAGTEVGEAVQGLRVRGAGSPELGRQVGRGDGEGGGHAGRRDAARIDAAISCVCV